jgi:hypothetical protein
MSQESTVAHDVPTLYQIFHQGGKDPRAPQFAEVLLHLDQSGSAGWLLVLEGMAGEIVELRRLAGFRRGDTKRKLNNLVADLEAVLENYADSDDVLEALAAFAPPRPGDIPADTGVIFLTRLKDSAERSARKIRGRGGRDALHDAMQIPGPRLFCAVGILEIRKKLGLTLSWKNEDAEAACEALWLAAGGQDDGATHGLGGVWQRYLRYGRTQKPAAVRARYIARSHISAVWHREK